MKKTILTGIKPTGRVHLGNYIGVIKPALELAKIDEYQTAYFIADYHGLINIHDAKELRELSYGIAATWLALGLDPNKSLLYRQSDIPEILELNWILSCFVSKGMMNRAHAYKAKVEKNLQSGIEVDSGVNIGLYNYPILMSADILMFKTDTVPVGKDQVQHVEITRDIAENFNRTYRDTFKLPEFLIQEQGSILPGLDGRKMSKSYGNTIPLFEEPNKLQKLINRIVTDSKPPEEPKNPNTSTLFTIYKEFVSQEEALRMSENFLNGISWGEVKQELFIVLNKALGGPREKYYEMIANPKVIDEILFDGAKKARAIAIPFLKEVKKQIGL
ncbi:MAG: trpS 2 [Bacillales bacterium]|jgi:tryptophanyl-tRNA synthetase|nr:trpS 2 [Bacillales bacterium]